MEEFELLESTFRKAGFQEEVTSCILESYFTSFCSVMNVYNQVFIIFGFLHMVLLSIRFKFGFPVINNNNNNNIAFCPKRVGVG